MSDTDSPVAAAGLPDGVAFRRYRHESDFAGVVDLLIELNRHERSLGAPRDMRRESAETCLADDSRKIRDWGGEQIVAVAGGHIVAYTALSLAETGPFLPFELRRHVYIENLVVAKAFRRRGIGRALIARAEALARFHGFKSVGLGFVPGNAPAESAYRQAGFTPSAIEMRKVLD
jgi:GNAT superfamily N-acetyltransferase